MSEDILIISQPDASQTDEQKRNNSKDMFRDISLPDTSQSKDQDSTSKIMKKPPLISAERSRAYRKKVIVEMTRFARAKGSKASNERREEEPTPWHLMRQKLADQMSSNEAQKNEHLSSPNLKNVLISVPQKEEVWSEFGDLKRNNNESSLKTVKQKKKDKTVAKVYKEETLKNKVGDKVGDKVGEKEVGDTINNSLGKRSIHLKNKPTELIIHGSCKDKSTSVKFNPGEDDSDKKKRKISTNCTNPGSKKPKQIDNTRLEKQKFIDSTSNNSKSYSEIEEPSLNCNSDKLEISKDNIVKESNHSKTRNKLSTNSNKANKSKPNIFSNSKNHNNFHTIIANGRNIKVVTFEGFLIKRSDAVHLKKLRNKLREQNIEKEKIKVIMKLERRKAEKALAREKNNVCFHCRRFGHNFSECPDIKDTEMSKSGMCFKCGSLEHSHFQCKVLQNEDFRYAVCFVCKEQGHIARQCSLNPQGQYPKGGSCHLCGEVTHLRKDCPKAIDEKPGNSITAEKLKNDNLEDISEVNSCKNKPDLKQKKIVRF